MTADVLALVLVAAGLHAAWNLLLKQSGDRIVAAWLIMVTGAVILVPVLALHPETIRRAWPNMLASGAVHCIYLYALAQAYEHGDLSVSYPLARGSAPVGVALVAVIAFDEPLTARAAAGLLLISGATIALGWSGASRRGARWALMTGAAIATYTLIDTGGVRAADHALAYTVGVSAVGAAVFGFVLWRTGHGPTELAAGLRADPVRLIGGGLASLAAYGLVLAAAQRSAIGGVAAVRETSVVLGALAGTVLLGEGRVVSRSTAAAVVAVGVLLLASG